MARIVEVQARRDTHNTEMVPCYLDFDRLVYAVDTHDQTGTRYLGLGFAGEDRTFVVYGDEAERIRQHLSRIAVPLAEPERRPSRPFQPAVGGERNIPEPR